MSDDGLDFDPDELEQFIRKYMEIDRGVQRPEGIFSILSGPREKQYQDALTYFLDPSQPHGFGNALLGQFLECVGVYESNLAGQHVEIDDEVRIADDGTDRRIDLVICGGRALADHPRWAVFLELKVGADEGDRQTTAYAEADEWDCRWFDTDTVSVDRLDETTYAYVKRAAADAPADRTGTFEPVDWAAVVAAFEAELRDTFGEYPTRSVVQVTDFIRSLKQTEGMTTDINEDEVNERLRLYFDHDRLIRQVEEATSQFESDFEALSTYLTDTWERRLTETYDFEGSGWKTSAPSNAKWQKLLPSYWDQDPLDQSSTICLYFRHAPTTQFLREQRLSFRLRLPPSRNVHTEPRHEGQSFNEVFLGTCTGEYSDRIHEALDPIGVDETNLGSASALVVKDYPLDPANLAGSYVDRLEDAVDEFCGHEPVLETFNEVFEETYREVFGEPPAGEFGGALQRRE